MCVERHSQCVYVSKNERKREKEREGEREREREREQWNITDLCHPLRNSLPDRTTAFPHQSKNRTHTQSSVSERKWERGEREKGESACVIPPSAQDFSRTHTHTKSAYIRSFPTTTDQQTNNKKTVTKSEKRGGD